MRASFVLVVCGLTLIATMGSAGRAQAPTAAATSSQPSGADTYEIRLEGGDLGLSGLHVLRTLSEAKVLPVHSVALGKDYTALCDVFTKETKLPGGCTQQLIDFATAFNEIKGSANQLARDTKVSYPVAAFEPYTYEKQYNLSAAADRVALRDDKRKAGQYMNDEAVMSRSGQFIEHTFEAYKLKITLPSGTSSEEVIRKLNAYPGVFVVKTPSVPASSKPPGYTMESRLEQIPVFCTGNGTPEEAYSQKYIGVTNLTERDCAKQPAGTCAEIVILDQPIAKNPEIDRIIGATGAQPGSPESLCTDPQVLGIARFHSTHMAGIIASKQNGIAFIGLHPGGLIAQGWDNDIAIADNVRARRTRDSLQVYLFARSWKLNASWAKGDRLLDPAHRIENIIGKRIHNLRESLWVVAAGQPSAEGLAQPTKIDEHLNLGPMNSGDQENVLVVGGCTDCASGKARIWGESHHSKTFVHVAAPADIVVSTATAGSYTWAQGTSQAAAFVAGVVSAMVSEWPTSYKFASRVKERLQYTATPLPLVADRDKVASGIINPALALKDPNRNYIDTTDPGKALEEVSIEGWCDGSLTVLTPDGNPVENANIFTSRIHRIVQVGSGHNRQWSIFSDKPFGEPLPGVITHIGPGLPTSPACTNVAIDSRPLLRIKTASGGRLITLQQIEDLLVRVDLPKVTCGCPTN